jgi:hypothetical protein
MEAGHFIDCHILVTREDVARAKTSISGLERGNADTNATHWLKEQGFEEPKSIDTDSPGVGEVLTNLARAYSLRRAFYHALFELVASGDVILTGDVTRWDPSLSYQTQRQSGSVKLQKVQFPAPTRFERLALTGDMPSDPDIFLQGIDCSQLNSGIREAIEQSLVCFHKGLYQPATVMLAAAAEATWTECGAAVATKVANQKLERVFADQYQSIAKKVNELRKALEHRKQKTF